MEKKKKTKERHYCEFSPDGSMISYIITEVPKKKRKKILKGENINGQI